LQIETPPICASTRETTLSHSSALSTLLEPAAAHLPSTQYAGAVASARARWLPRGVWARARTTAPNQQVL